MSLARIQSQAKVPGEVRKVMRQAKVPYTVIDFGTNQGAMKSWRTDFDRKADESSVRYQEQARERAVGRFVELGWGTEPEVTVIAPRAREGLFERAFNAVKRFFARLYEGANLSN